jgi:site-specific recombinase XerD
MKTQLFVSFLARKAMIKKTGMVPIYCRVRYSDTTAQFSTKIDVLYINWDSKRTRVKGNRKKAMNLKLETLRISIIEKYDALIKTNVIITAKTIIDYYKNDTLIMNSVINVFKQHNTNMKSLIGIEYSFGSYKNYKTTLKHLIKYINTKYNANDLFLNKINYDFIYNFSQFLLLHTECNHNGMMKHIQRFKKITNFCIKNNYITNNPFVGFKISFKKSNRVYINKDELYTLKNITLNDSLSKVRDIFLFACYTGLSYIDLYNLSLNNIRKGNDNLQWVYVKRHKTNIPSNIPILPPAFSILKKYKKQKNVNRIFPMISNQKINKALKEIAHLCNFNKKLTFHSARHTFATTVTLTNGVPIETVSKMLGHNNIKTTQIYARVIDSKVSQDMLILRQKFM